MDDLSALDDIPDPGVLPVRLPDGRAICLVRSGTQVTAFLDECPHNGMPLSAGDLLSGCELECTWHGARFDCRTGALRRGPAEADLTPVAVRVVGSRVVLDSPQT
ncbi:MAG: Rieske (2Fe-2S) protein [Gemmatimonadaceae bacterium]